MKTLLYALIALCLAALPAYKIAGNLLHEFGHSFELYQTFGGLATEPNDDGITDTALDHNPTAGNGRNETAVRNDIAFLNFSHAYGSLTAAEKQLVDNTANNLMSHRQLFYDDPATGKIVPDGERFGPARAPLGVTRVTVAWPAAAVGYKLPVFTRSGIVDRVPGRHHQWCVQHRLSPSQRPAVFLPAQEASVMPEGKGNTGNRAACPRGDGT